MNFFERLLKGVWGKGCIKRSSMERTFEMIKIEPMYTQGMDELRQAFLVCMIIDLLSRPHQRSANSKYKKLLYCRYRKSSVSSVGP